jgi:hypothetical protein
MKFELPLNLSPAALGEKVYSPSQLLDGKSTGQKTIAKDRVWAV